MTNPSTEALKHHLTLCDEVYQLTLEENRFLKQHQRTPEAAILDRKRALLTKLDESLTALKSGSPAPAGATSAARPDPLRKEIVEKARGKLLQILHLDRENEQLLLRYSLGGPTRSAPAAAAPAAPAPSQIQRLYDRHA